jgi:hypothetical protein
MGLFVFSDDRESRRIQQYHYHCQLVHAMSYDVKVGATQCEAVTSKRGARCRLGVLSSMPSWRKAFGACRDYCKNECLSSKRLPEQRLRLRRNRSLNRESVVDLPPHLSHVSFD